MRKLWIALLAVVLALSLATAVGCGSKKSGGGGGGSAALTGNDIAAKSDAAMAKVTSSTIGVDASATINADLSKASAQTKAILSGPITLTGTIKAAEASGTVSAMDLAMAAKAGGQKLDLGLKIDGKKGWLGFMGQWYALPPSALSTLGSPAPSASAAGGGIESQLGALGIDTKTWITGRTIVGTETLDGKSVYHVSDTLNTAAIGQSVGSLAQQGLALSGGLGATTSPQNLKEAQALAQALQQGLKDVKVDAWYETDTFYMRKLVVSAALDVSSDPAAATAGLKGGSFTLTVTMGDFGAPVTVTPPASSQSLDKLLSGLSSLSAGL